MEEKNNNRERLENWFHNERKEAGEQFIRDFFCDENSKDQLRQILYSRFYEIIEGKTDIPEKNLDHILYRIHYDINSSENHKKSMFLSWALKAAAVIFLPLLIFWGLRGFREYNSAKDAIVEIHSPAWTRTSFTLPDGTTGWLNSSSSIRYNMNFTNDRQLALKGEGYFSVVSDKSKPFRVSAGDVTIKVHGTKFNVASWDEDKNIEVVLEEGIIELSGGDIKKPVMLQPSQLAIFDKSGKSVTTEIIETRKYLSWTEGKLVFRNDPIEIVKKRLERWYDINVEVTGSFSDDFRLRATFVDESLEDVLAILKRSIGIDYKIEAPGINVDGTYEKTKVIISK